jgi:hypothetical protein
VEARSGRFNRRGKNFGLSWCGKRECAEGLNTNGTKRSVTESGGSRGKLSLAEEKGNFFLH